MEIINIATTSQLKLAQFARFFVKKGITVRGIELNIPEVQDIDVSKVCQFKLSMAMQLTQKRPLIVDDTGLIVSALDGFPGALLNPILNEGRVKLLDKITKYFQHNGIIDACFRSAVGLAIENKTYFGVGDSEGFLDFSVPNTSEDQNCTRIFFPEDGGGHSLAAVSNDEFPKIFFHRLLALETVFSLIPGKANDGK